LRIAHARFRRAKPELDAAIEERQNAVLHALNVGIDTCDIAEIYETVRSQVSWLTARALGQDTTRATNGAR
jgi:hypothetical protein